MRHSRNLMKGFTILELVVTLVILVALGSLAVPAFLDYKQRAYFGEVVAAADPFKEAVTKCYQDIKKFKGCSGGKNHVPANITTAKGAVASVMVVDGVITVVPVPAHSIKATDTYILTPKIEKGAVTWTPTGNGVANGFLNS